jgi:hypothetical protein
LTVGVAFTVIVTFDVTAGHGAMPVVVRSRLADPEKLEGGVHVALRSLALGVKTPPEVVDQVPPVADPPTVPDSDTDPP